MNTESATPATTEPRQSTLGNPRTIAFIAAGGLIVGALLPWVTVLGAIHVSGFEGGDGKITAILGVLAALAMLSIKRWRRRVALACGVLSAVVGIYDLCNISNRAAEAEFAASVGYGLYLTVLAALALVVAVFKAKPIKVDATS